MRRHDVDKIPRIDPLNRLVPRSAILLAQEVPREALLPKGRPLRRAHLCKQGAEDAARGALARPGVLLGGRHVEEQISLDERL